MRKLIVCIADGAADEPSLCPKGTPLERASTPILDNMTRRSVAGLCRTIPKGFPPDSDVGNMYLLGFPPQRYHHGRAPIEAAAKDISTTEQDCIWRVTFCKRTADTITTPCASSLTQEEGETLIAYLAHAFAGTNFAFIPNGSYRHLLVHRGGQNRHHFQSYTPRGPHMLRGESVQAHIAKYPQQLQHVIEKASSILAQHSGKTNQLWLWGQGQPYTLPKFATQFNAAACVVSGTPLLHGLGTMAGCTVYKDAAFTALPNTNLQKKARMACDFLNSSDHHRIAFIHVEAPDHCGHLGDTAGKITAIERIDREMLPILLKECPEAAIAMTVDHLTPVATKSHAAGDVPFMLYHPAIPPQRTILRFTETACKKGVCLKGTLLLSQLIAWTNALHTKPSCSISAVSRT
ncbi:MAG: alkaline phosphatase family protein [Desulfovibrionales bacterium]|nr:alkaline phosphatase family protein [Desulfovibrionales bacterium]